MIHNSFIFLERIGPITEQNLWSQGISDWNSFLDSRIVKGFSVVRKKYYDKRLIEAKKAVRDYDSSFFISFPPSEVWRTYDFFRDDALFLDIETSGYYGDITVLGCYDGDRTFTLVKDRSLTKRNLQQLFLGKKLIVTFNGASFDLPVIDRYFPGILPDVPHLDLRFPLARLGLSGGLKQIEKDVGISRSAIVDGMRGEDAVALWHDYLLTGNPDSLDRIVAYNEEDVLNLRPLADFVFKSLSRRLKSSFGL